MKYEPFGPTKAKLGGPDSRRDSAKRLAPRIGIMIGWKNVKLGGLKS